MSRPAFIAGVFDRYERMTTAQLLLAFLPSVAMAVGLAASAGLRAWLPLLVTAVLARLEVVELGEAFSFMASTPALIVFGVATVLEIVADKAPVLDHGLDLVSTVVRPLAATVLSAAVMFQINDPLWALGLGLIVGAPMSLVPHAAKSGVRLATTTTTAGIANPFVSVLEDVISVVLIVLAVVIPILTAIAAIVVSLFVVRWWRRRRGSAAVDAPR